MQKFLDVSILLPAMNETYSLEQTIEIILQTCNNEEIAEMIILLSKKSTNECKEIAEKMCEKYPGKVYIHYQTLPFVGGACREGFDLAKGSHVVLMSTDLETDPHLIHKFIEEEKKNPKGIVTASRWMKGCNFDGYSKVKLVCNYIFQKMLGLLFGTKLTDMTYAFRIFPTNLVQKINWEELKHPFFLETALKPLRLKTKFKEIPANWVARTEGESQNSFFANFKYFRVVYHVRFCRKESLLKENVKKD